MVLRWSSSSKDSTITDEDIDRIIGKGEEATAELDAKMKKFTEDVLQFKMDDSADIYDFDDDNKDENKLDFKKIVSNNWNDPPKRERKRNYSESEYFKKTLRQGAPAKPKEPRIPCMPQLHDFQFFKIHRLTELYEKEVRYLMVGLSIRVTGLYCLIEPFHVIIAYCFHLVSANTSEKPVERHS